LVTQSRSASLVASLSVRLPRHVLRAHVDHALEPEPGAHRRRGDAVLARAGLGDDAPLPHPEREQRLPDRVVDLVGAGVVQVFPLEHHRRAGLGAEARRLGERRGPAHVFGEQPLELGPERRIGAHAVVQRREIVQRGDEGLGHVPPAVRTEAPVDGPLS
jgi:hypothetical protein